MILASTEPEPIGCIGAASHLTRISDLATTPSAGARQENLGALAGLKDAARVLFFLIKNIYSNKPTDDMLIQNRG